MKATRYLSIVFLVWIMASVALVTFTGVIDSLGISPIRVTIKQLNELKPLRQNQDRQVKPYEGWRLQPRTIFLGSSRAKQSIDPKLLENTQYAPAYNSGLDGAMDFGEFRDFVEHFLRVDRNLRTIFIEIFPTALIGTPIKPAFGFGVERYANDFVSVFMSWNGVRYALRTIVYNTASSVDATSKAITLSVTSARDGFEPVVAGTHHFSIKNIPNAILYLKIFGQPPNIDSKVFTDAAEIIRMCKSYSVDCRFFISPLHADVLLAMKHLGIWPQLEALKSGLARLAPTYDFARFNELMDERIGPVVYWPEAFHYSPALGALTVKAMTGQRTKDMPDNFGRLLDSGNIESEIIASRHELDEWARNHKSFILRLQTAEKNYARGVSFKEVTDAEIAAGGY
jgi:hypothetical protein